MPRQRRTIISNSLVHVISRVVDGRFVFDESARRYYLAQLGRSLTRCDWRLVAYAIMSNHIHLALVSGACSLRHWIHPLHVSMAHWVTRQLRVENPRARGHVFADRPMTRLMDRERGGVLLAYLHNNPVRAGVVDNPLRSDWTSHRFYSRSRIPPAWLHVELGLSLSGFGAHTAGRRAFHRFVCGRADGTLEGDASSDVAQQRGGVVDLLEAGGRPKLEPDHLVAAASRHVGIPVVRVLSRSRDRACVRARRLSLLVSDRMQYPRTALCGRLAISAAAASRLVSGARDGREDAVVRQIVQELTS